MWKHVLVTLLVITLVPPVWSDEPESPEKEAGTNAEDASKSADDLSWWSIDSGGGQSSSGNLSLSSSIGQPDAGVVSRDGYVFAGGILSGPVDLKHVFYDGFESGDVSSWSASVGDDP